MQIFDETYFKSIFYKNFDRIYNGFLRKTKEDAIAQDLTQQTFIKFWEYRSSYSFDLPATLQLNRKAKLVFIDWLRKEAHQRKLSKEMQQYYIPAAPHSKWELTNTLQIAIDKLPPSRKKIFMLAYVEGYSHKEIAAHLNISTKTVDNQVLKALQQLRKIIALYAILSIIS